MYLIKLYSDNPKFETIYFKPWLNVIFWDQEREWDSKRSENGIWKTKLVQLIDFMLIKQSSELYNKMKEKLPHSVFCLEVQYAESAFLTIMRYSYDTKVAIKIHKKSNQNFLEISWERKKWEYYWLCQDNADEIINSYFKFDNQIPSYRKVLWYFLREQTDFRDPFRHANTYKHKDRKPYLYALLWFDSKPLIEKYSLDEEKDILVKTINGLRRKTSGMSLNEQESLKEKLEQQIAILRNEIEWFSFNTENMDNFNISDLVQNIENEITKINDCQYKIETELKIIEESISEQQNEVSENQIKRFFKELWDSLSLEWDQLKQRLLEVKKFQEQITKERNNFLIQKKKTLLQKKEEYWIRYQELDSEREHLLKKIKETNTLKKFAQKELVISELSEQLKSIDERLATFRIISEQVKSVEEIDEKINILANIIDEQTKKSNYPLFFKEIEGIFTSAYKNIIGKEYEFPILSVSKNNEENVDFSCKVYNSQTQENIDITDWHTMRKTICAIFVLAIMITYAKNNLNCFRFAYHDWVLDWASKEVKKAFIEEVKKLSEKYNIQYIVSMIKTDFEKENPLIADDIILTLSEEKNLFWVAF